LPIDPGTRLGPYEISSRIGAGGMGEVWRARDTRLGRDVAIKVLPEGVAQNDEFLVRFEREAKTISSLNHPNICTLFDVGHESGAHFLVMELIEGESLADRLQKGPLSPDQVLKIGAQIADALNRAHKQGIVHRDLKPGNVMLTKTGAKLLDFGLARSEADAAPLHGLTQMATQEKPVTQEGTILGTFQYMAPEQLEGQPADARTDIFALGALLYEMATGKRAFDGKSRTSLIAAIVSSQPTPISQVTPMTPPALDHVVRKCLEKDPDDRWQSAHDVASELRWISEAGPQAGIAAPLTLRRKTRERLAWALNPVTAVVAATVTWMVVVPRDSPRPIVESAVVVPSGMRVGLDGGLAISPDGSTVAVVLNDLRGGSSLWVRPMDSGAYRQLADTGYANYPFWSPDSRSIGFFASGKLKSVEAAGGGVRVICDAPNGRGGSWGRDGTIVMAPSGIGPLTKVPATGGQPTPLTKLRAGDSSHRWPWFLPDGKRFLFLAMVGVGGSGPTSAICQASLDNPDDIKVVVGASSSMAYVASGYILYARDNTVVAQRYDPDRGQTSGSAVVVADLVAFTDRFFALFTVSDDGSLLYLRGTGFQLSQLVWVDRSGRSVGVATEPGLFFSPTLSRDQRRLAVDLSNTIDGQGDIWVYDLARNVSNRLTFDKTNESSPLWSADDKRVIYFATKEGTGNIYQISSGGTGQAETIVDDDREKRPTDVSRDGKWIVFNSAGGASGGNMDIWIWSAEDKKARPWLATPFTEQCAQLSPDARWIAYQSDESGRNEIYVRAFPDATEKWRISTDGGVMSAWRSDGKELYYISGDRKMMAVAVTAGAEFSTATPVALFDAPVRAHPTRQFDISLDGTRFLLNRQSDTGVGEHITLLQNWQAKIPGQ
jgi:Tol biopolymer transport system component